MKTLKILSALLCYPTLPLKAAIPEIRQALAEENLVPRRHRPALDGLLKALETGDLYDLQEAYILLFDRTRALSLHLFEHVHGESRDRGQAMVDLLQLYEAGGYSPTPSELPDFLPLFLEYASTLTPQAALDLIAEPNHIFAALRERLLKRQTPYESLFAILVDLAGAPLDAKALAALRAEPDPEPEDLAALDAAWEEEEVRFTPGGAESCGKDRLIAKIRQARRPSPGLAPASRS